MPATETLGVNQSAVVHRRAMPTRIWETLGSTSGGGAVVGVAAELLLDAPAAGALLSCSCNATCCTVSTAWSRTTVSSTAARRSRMGRRVRICCGVDSRDGTMNLSCLASMSRISSSSTMGELLLALVVLLGGLLPAAGGMTDPSAPCCSTSDCRYGTSCVMTASLLPFSSHMARATTCKRFMASTLDSVEPDDICDWNSASGDRLGISSAVCGSVRARVMLGVGVTPVISKLMFGMVLLRCVLLRACARAMLRCGCVCSGQLCSSRVAPPGNAASSVCLRVLVRNLSQRRSDGCACLLVLRCWRCVCSFSFSPSRCRAEQSINLLTPLLVCL
mmetsp:Transcript_20185/g.57307  ORF Transcript_20185/g.57307 Transcript_20185/m.57307 type:complete len:333 (-) Transcript_20185:133-1131(-)